MAPALQHLEATYENRVAVWRVNADEQPAAVQALGVHGIPTLVAFAGGQEQWRRTGAQSAGALTTLFAALESEQAPPPASLTTTPGTASGWGWLLLVWRVHRPCPMVVGGRCGRTFSAIRPLRWRAITAAEQA
jgi:hypothetical protein